MSKRFLKLNLDTDEAEFLAKNHPNAFILLFFIAKRARRINGLADGLNIGECHLGDWESIGFSRQNYRTALKVLILKKFIEIIETNRTRKKSTTGLTTEGTKVKLLNSVVWDINYDEDNHRPNHCLTTAQPLPNHEQERIRKKKKEEENKQPYIPSFSNPQKIKFRDHVELFQSEYDSLLSKHGQEFLDRMLDTLDAYKGSTGKVYKSDYHTMREGGWVIDSVNKKSLTKPSYEKSQGNSSKGGKGPEPRYQPSRVLRGSNNAIEGN